MKGFIRSFDEKNKNAFASESLQKIQATKGDRNRSGTTSPPHNLEKKKQRVLPGALPSTFTQRGRQYQQRPDTPEKKI